MSSRCNHTSGVSIMPDTGREHLERRLRACGAARAAFIPFISAGDPDFETSVNIARLLARHADAIEIGIPYSDPLADGPVIQEASLRALRGGMTMTRAFDLMRAVRARSDVPLIAFTYANPVIQAGPAAFARTCRESGVNGIIVPDLPVEESGELRAAADREGVALIPLLALTSGDRIRRIAAGARGFVYCVSSLGVTGERNSFSDQLRSFVESVRRHAAVPVAVGFGVSRPDHVRELSAFADGVVVGSAIVRLCGAMEPAVRDKDAGLLQTKMDELEQFCADLVHGALREGAPS